MTSALRMPPPAADSSPGPRGACFRRDLLELYSRHPRPRSARRTHDGSSPPARRRHRRLLSALPAPHEPRLGEPVRRGGGQGDLPDLPQHPRLPSRPGPAEAQDQERKGQPHRAGARGDAAPARAAPPASRPPQEETRPLGRGGAPQEEVVRAVDVIQRKRDGLELTREEIDFFIRGYATGQIPDYQASAFTMAVFFRGMTAGETVALTEAMMRTGEVLDFSDLPGPKVDKHSKALAETMVEIGRGMGKKVAALITDMDQPLGHAVGNALEVVECVDTLKGRGPSDLESLSLELAAWMLHLGGVTNHLEAARARVRDALASGAGLRKLREVVELQGGDPRVVDDPGLLPRAREALPLRADRDGRVTRIACGAVGHAAMLLGAGRETVESAIDPAVGLVLHKKVGELVIQGEPLLTLHVNDRTHLEEVTSLLRDAIRVGPEAPARTALIRAVLD